MADLIDRAELVDFMDRVYHAMEADMLAADNAAYLRGYKAALEKVKEATAFRHPPLSDALAFIEDFAVAKIDALPVARNFRSPEDEPDPVVDADTVWAWQADAREIVEKARAAE